MTTMNSPTEPAPLGANEAHDMPSDVKPEFFVSTYTASQFYQPLPPKWLKMKTCIPKNLEKPARESLKALETLADIRTKLNGYDTGQVDLLIDHKINLGAQFTPRNAFDYPEEYQLERLSRLAEVRRKLAETDYGLANLDAVLKSGFDVLIMATGISRSHSVSDRSLCWKSCMLTWKSTLPHVFPSLLSRPAHSRSPAKAPSPRSNSFSTTAPGRSVSTKAIDRSAGKARRFSSPCAISGRLPGRRRAPRSACTCSTRTILSTSLA